MSRSTHRRSGRDEEAAVTRFRYSRNETPELSDDELSFELFAEPSYEESSPGPRSILRQSSHGEPKRTWASRLGGRSTKIACVLLALAAAFIAAATRRQGVGVSQKKRNAAASFGVDGGERGPVSGRGGGGGGGESVPWTTYSSTSDESCDESHVVVLQGDSSKTRGSAVKKGGETQIRRRLAATSGDESRIISIQKNTLRSGSKNSKASRKSKSIKSKGSKSGNKVRIAQDVAQSVARKNSPSTWMFQICSVLPRRRRRARARNLEG